MRMDTAGSKETGMLPGDQCQCKYSAAFQKINNIRVGMRIIPNTGSIIYTIEIVYVCSVANDTVLKFALKKCTSKQVSSLKVTYILKIY